MKKSNKIVSIPRFTIFVAFCTILILYLAGALFNMYDTYYVQAGSIDAYTTIEVEHGESLWSIAKEHYPEERDLRHAIYEIKKVNNMETCNITAGQDLRLPLYI